MIELSEISTNLVRSDSGIWFSEQKEAISYPEEGNETCFDIEEGSFWYDHRNQVIGEVVKQFLPSGPLFDVGGGNGVVARALHHLGIDVFLIEPGEDGISNAKKRGLPHLIHSSFRNSGFKGNSLPAIGIFDVLEHVPADRTFLEMLKKALVEGGKLFITVPAYPFLWSHYDEQVGHFRRYTVSGLNRMLTEFGFQIDYSTYFFAILPIPVFFFRTIPYLTGISRNITPAGKQKDHLIHQTKKRQVINWILKNELGWIQNQKYLPFGTSCLIVATKRSL